MTATEPFHEFAEDPRLLDIYYGSFLRARRLIHNRPDRETRTPAYAADLWRMVGVSPRDFPATITVAGSKGKGSTAAMLASILQASGARVGLVTSPHLRSFRERIRINGRSISPDQLSSALDAVAPAVSDLTRRIDPPRYLGPGGIALAMALLLFRQADVTVCIVEAGRGGEFDEARIMAADISVLTRVMREHTAYLGDTLAAIATTKARITTPGKPLVVAPQEPAIYPAVAAVAQEIAAPLVPVQHTTAVNDMADAGPLMTADLTINGTDYAHLEIGLHGAHQLDNAATAIVAAQLAAAPGVSVTEASIRVGLRRVRMPGRLQRLNECPLVVLDGAINAQSAEQARAYFRTFPSQRRTAVIAVPVDKDLAGVCEIIAPLVDRLILTEVPSERLTWNPEAQGIAERYHPQVRVSRPADAAFGSVMADAEDQDGILLLGTQTFVANALHFWDAEADALW